MSKRCTSCGKFLTDTDRFCPDCGANCPEEVTPANNGVLTANVPPETDTYSQPQYNNPYQQSSPPPYPPSAAPQYSPYPPEDSEEMSVGKWVLTILVTNLGIIGIVFLFIWGFGSGPKARQNYCKAMLIFAAIGIVLSFLMVLVYIGIFGALLGEISNEFDFDTTYTMAKSIIPFLS